MPKETEYGPKYYELMEKAEATLDLARLATLEAESIDKIDRLVKVGEIYRDFAAMYRHAQSGF